MLFQVFELMEDTVGVSLPRCTLEPPHYDGIQSLCLMGDLLFSGSRDSCIKKWDLADEQLQHVSTHSCQQLMPAAAGWIILPVRVFCTALQT